MISLLIGNQFGQLLVPVGFSDTDFPETKEILGAVGALVVNLLGRDETKSGEVRDLLETANSLACPLEPQRRKER